MDYSKINVALSAIREALAEKKEPKLGSGERFKKLVAKLKDKAEDPKALAAAIGRKKYGAKKFAALAKHGK